MKGFEGWRAAGGIALVCLVGYANSFSGSFQYDDFHSLVENKAVRSLVNVPRFFVDPGLFSGEPDKGMYRPVLLVSYALNYAAGEYRVWGYHLVNLGLHAVCSLLVWMLGLRLLKSRREALLAGLLFALHPLATEPVNYISSRSESLVACFYLSSFLLHLQGNETPAGPSKSGKWSAWPFRFLSVAVYGLGLLTKSVAITVPALMWLHDRMVGGRNLKGWVYAPYAAVGGGYLLLIRQNGFLTRSMAEPVRSWSAQLWTQSKALVYYLKLLFVPHDLNVEHQFFAATRAGEGAVWVGMALVVSLALLAWCSRRKLAGFCLAWGAVVLLPSTLMPLNVLVNERRLYLALAGFAWFCGWVSRHLHGRTLWVVLPLLGILTWQRNAVWRDEMSLWQDAVSKAPGMYRARTHLGKALQLRGDPEGALREYQQAIEIDASHGDAFNNIATLYHEQAKQERDPEKREKLLEQAIPWYGLALERYPKNAKIHQNLGDAHAEMGIFREALAAYEKSLGIDPGDGAVWSNYGQTLYRAGNLEKAEKAFLRAAVLLPKQPEPYNNLGNVYSRRGELEKAAAMYREAIVRQPEAMAQVLVNLGDTYRQLGDLESARETLGRALGNDPEWALAHYHLGRVERAAGERRAAREALARAVRLDPGQVKARIEWAELLAEEEACGQAIRLFREAVDRDPDNSRGWYGLGRCLEEKGDRSEGVRAYGRFLETWNHRDERYRWVEERVRILREESEK